MRTRDRGFVYFITDGQAIKIGFSRYPDGRQSDLQVAHYLPLRQIAQFFGAWSDEAFLHRKFQHLRIRGEWFRPETELIEFIAALERDRRWFDTRQVTIAGYVQGKHRPIELARNVRAECARMIEWIDAKLAAGAFADEAMTRRARFARMDVDALRREGASQSKAFIAAALANMAQLRAVDAQIGG